MIPPRTCLKLSEQIFNSFHFIRRKDFLFYFSIEMAEKNCDGSQQIDLEEQRLLDEYEQLTLKLHKQKLMLATLKNIDCNGIKNVDATGKKNIDMALNYVRAYDYLKMDNAGTNVLGIPDKPRELSYIEKRALKEKFLEELPKQYEKELNFCRQITPEIDASTALDKEMLELKTREKEMVDALGRDKMELCETLVECAEIRFGPSLVNDAKITKAKFGVEQVKAQLIETLLEENVNNMSNHITNAMGKIENILDTAIAEKDANDGNE